MRGEDRGVGLLSDEHNVSLNAEEIRGLSEEINSRMLHAPSYLSSFERRISLKCVRLDFKYYLFKPFIY